MRLARLVRLALPLACGLALLLPSSCGSSDAPPRSLLATGCAINSECAAPLVCAFQRCHQQCSASRDCSGGERCVVAARTGVCQLEDEAVCGKDSDCALGQVCDQGSCRSGCRDSSACLASQRCVAFACHDTDEGDAGDAGDAGVPPVCSAATLATDCPSNACRSALACSADGQCVYQPLAPASCGTCGLGKPSCADPTAPACEDIELLGLAPAEIECDASAQNSSFVYLAPSFTGPTSDGSADKPFTALADALALASLAGRAPTHIVIAGSPVFDETLVLPDGVSIRGGYTASDDTGAFTGKWRRDRSNRPAWRVTDEQLSVADNLLIALRAEHVHRISIVSDVTFETKAIRATGSADGASNIAVVANDAGGLRLFDVTVIAGDAQPGGQGAVGAAAMNGPNLHGINSTVSSGTGVPAHVAGLTGAHNSLCDVPESQGGDGGDLGPARYDGHDAPSGAKGDTGSGAQDGAPQTGSAAAGSDGVCGVEFSSAALFTLLGSGAPGNEGAPGRGGGGGLSDYGLFATNLYLISPGGSGAAGGCGGHGGKGGYAGGWSVGVLELDSSGMVIRGGSVTSGKGGDGGPGSDGGPGAPGSQGGGGAKDSGNPPVVSSTKGGNSSDGQPGGHGGHGAGGSSVAVYCSGAVITSSEPPLLTPGSVGVGGSGMIAEPSNGCGL